MHHLAQGTQATRRRVVGSVPQPQTTIGEDPIVVPVVLHPPLTRSPSSMRIQDPAREPRYSFEAVIRDLLGLMQRHSRQGSNSGRICLGIPPITAVEHVPGWKGSAEPTTPRRGDAGGHPGPPREQHASDRHGGDRRGDGYPAQVLLTRPEFGPPAPATSVRPLRSRMSPDKQPNQTQVALVEHFGCDARTGGPRPIRVTSAPGAAEPGGRRSRHRGRRATARSSPSVTPIRAPGEQTI